jgi:DNA-binding MarR family transcriptional regulator
MSVSPAIFDLGAHGKVLATRTDGREVGRAAADRLQAAPVLMLGFWGVEVASPPFLDELLRALRVVLLGGDSSRLLIAAGLNEDVAESLEIVLERHGGSMAALTNGQMRLLGGSKQLKDTLREAQDLGYFTAPQLAERLALKLPNLHARLKALAEAGAVAREEDSSGHEVNRGRHARSFHAPDVRVLEAAACTR